MADPKCIDHVGHGVNWEVSRDVKASLGLVVKHPDIQVSQTELFRQDGHILVRFVRGD